MKARIHSPSEMVSRFTVLVSDYRNVRGFSLLNCCVDEVCFLDQQDEEKIKSDVELIQAMRPGLANTQGRMVCIGSPYAQRGWAYSTWKKSFGNDNSKTLVWRSPSRTINPTLPQSVIDDALAEDPAAARSEYLAEWRTDIAAFVSRELVESLVIPNRGNLPPRQGIKYAAFADLSGGRNDSASISIGSKQGHTVVIDYLEEFKSPHDPYGIIARMTAIIRSYGLTKATGDAYSAEFSRQAFSSHGIVYENFSTSHWKSGAGAKTKIAKPRSILYSELLPLMTASEIQLPDNDTLVTQLSSLERKTRSGGRDQIDHPPRNFHDDLSNVVAGVASVVSERVIRAEVIDLNVSDDPENTAYAQACRHFEIRQKQFEREQEWLTQPDNNEDPMHIVSKFRS
jgi:hypothetical protein